MTYFQFIKYLVTFGNDDDFSCRFTLPLMAFRIKYAGSDALAGINIVIPITCVTLRNRSLLCWPPAPVPS